MREFFHKFAHAASVIVGSAWAFLIAVLFIVAWASTGPAFQFSDTWQLIVNTTTTIITFLMVFLIQNTQNRDAQAIHLKLDELLRAVAHARTGLVELEKLSDAELDKLEEEFARLRNWPEHPETPANERSTAGPGQSADKIVNKVRRRRSRKKR